MSQTADTDPILYLEFWQLQRCSRCDGRDPLCGHDDKLYLHAACHPDPPWVYFKNDLLHLECSVCGRGGVRIPIESDKAAVGYRWRWKANDEYPAGDWHYAGGCPALVAPDVEWEPLAVTEGGNVTEQPVPPL